MSYLSTESSNLGPVWMGQMAKTSQKHTTTQTQETQKHTVFSPTQHSMFGGDSQAMCFLNFKPANY